MENGSENLLKCLEFRQEISTMIQEVMDTKHLILKALDLTDDSSDEASEALRQKSLERGYLELLQIDSIFWQVHQNFPQVGQIAHFDS